MGSPRIKLVIVSLLFCSHLLASDWLLEHSPLLPETGTIAKEQSFIDLQGGSHILMITVAPGFEDLSALSYLRFHFGAVVSSAYITNGEEVPNDFDGESFQQTAIRRKEEAVNVMRSLGGDAYFFNVPSNLFWKCGIANDFSSIQSEFSSSLKRILIATKPDVVMIAYDYSFPCFDSSRISFIKNEVLSLIKNNKKNNIFPEPRVIVQESKSPLFHFPVGSVDKPRKKTYGELADEIGKAYRSLGGYRSIWTKEFKTGYTLLYPSAQRGFRLSRLQSPIRSSRVSKLHADVMQLIRGHSLNNTASAIDLVDAFINSHSKNMDDVEQRNIVDIKKGLERYRCALLNISIPISIDFNYVLPIQVFFLRLGAMPGWADHGENLVMFPQAQGKDWIVNEKHFQYYNFVPDTVYRIVTSRTLSLTDPVTREGFVADQMYFTFTVMVIHKDKDKSHNFIFQRDIPLIVTQRQTLEVLNPIIGAKIDDKIIIRVTNNSHDKVRSTLFIKDSIVSSPELIDYLDHKREQVVDTFHLEWAPSKTINDHILSLKIKNGMPVASVISKALRVILPDQNNNVGVFANEEDNGLQKALSRLNIPNTKFDISNCTENLLKRYVTIILDEFSYNLLYSSPLSRERILQWVRNGGKLVMLAQNPALPFPDDSVRCNFNEPVLALNDSDIIVNEKLATFPNNIFKEEWKDWLFAYANCSLDIKNTNLISEVLLRSGAGNKPMIVKRSYGDGTIIYCSLNIKMQLSNYQNVAYKLLVNLIWN